MNHHNKRPETSFPHLAFPRCWQVLAALATLAVIVLSLMPKPPQPPGALSWDKAQHVLAYFVLAAAWVQATRGRWWLLTASIVFALGLTLELLQGMGGPRQLQLTDMLANAIGVGAGAGLCLTPFGRSLGLLDTVVARLLTGKPTGKQGGR
jgi:VanZ family protein